MTEPTAPTSERTERTTVLRTLGEFLRLVLIAAAIAIPIRYFVAQPFIVRGASMEPNFSDQQYLVVDELSYFLREPKRGEVIVFRYPLNQREYFIKRIVGLPGESVTIKDGIVTIVNDEHPEGLMLDEWYLATSLTWGGEYHFMLGESEYLVLGDNRPASSDSRIWGPLERQLITGRAFFRAWPPDEFGTIQNP